MNTPKDSDLRKTYGMRAFAVQFFGFEDMSIGWLVMICSAKLT